MSEAELPRVKRPVKVEPPPKAPEPKTWDELMVAGAARVRGEQAELGLQHLLDALREAESKQDGLRRCCTLYLLGLVYEPNKDQGESARAAFRKACELWEPGFHRTEAVAVLLKALEDPAFTAEWRTLAERVEWCALDSTLKPVVSPRQELKKPEPPAEPPPKKRWPF